MQKKIEGSFGVVLFGVSDAETEQIAQRIELHLREYLSTCGTGYSQLEYIRIIAYDD